MSHSELFCNGEAPRNSASGAVVSCSIDYLSERGGPRGDSFDGIVLSRAPGLDDRLGVRGLQVHQSGLLGPGNVASR